VSSAPKWSGAISPGQVVVRIDPRYFRPTEVDVLQADIGKLRRLLNWEPKTRFKELVKIMVEADLHEEGKR
jgi:GDPmannose 4,6-dehydratase